jgi:ectoine hydroxylase-related dioxygenase (phytanoyl-CoA dioxygenase family)
MSAVTDLGKTYAEDGVLPSIDIFTESEIEAFRSSFDELEAEEGRENCQIGLQARHLDREFIWQLSADPRVLDVMEQAMGPDILLLSTHFFCKYPDPTGSRFVAWHQDVTYWGLEPPTAHTAWIAIDDSDVENGCMHVIPGSHRDGLVLHSKSEQQGNLLSINQEIPDELVDTSKAIDLELKAGQMSVHDGQLFHASMPNTSDRRRCGLTVRFIPPEARQKEANSVGHMWKPILVRGEDRFNHYQETPAPFEMP